MKYYLAAFEDVPITGYVRTAYKDGENKTQGFSWICKSARVNGYDKGMESGLPSADGVLRLETQFLNSSAARNIAKRNDCFRTAGDLVDGNIGRLEIKHWLDRIGHNNKIYCASSLYDELLDKFGYEGAAARYFFVEGFKKKGSYMKKLSSQNTYDRRKKEMDAEGWLFQSEHELRQLIVDGINETNKRNSVDIASVDDLCTDSSSVDNPFSDN